MNPRVTNVVPRAPHRLEITFSDGQRRNFDVTPYLTYPVFQHLANPSFFNLARAERGTVSWPDGTDFCPDTLFMESTSEASQPIRR